MLCLMSATRFIWLLEMARGMSYLRLSTFMTLEEKAGMGDEPGTLIMTYCWFSAGTCPSTRLRVAPLCVRVPPTFKAPKAAPAAFVPTHTVSVEPLAKVRLLLIVEVPFDTTSEPPLPMVTAPP